jgi:hypothetical protein
LGTHEDAELTPQPFIIKIEEPVTLGSATPRGALAQLLESPDNGVKVGGAGGVDRNMNLLESPSRGDDEVKAPVTHESARGPSSGVVGHPQPDEVIETCKPLPSAPIVGVFVPPASEFVFARLAQMVCKEDTKVYTGSGGMSLRLVRAACILALVCSRGYKRAREGMGSQVFGGEVLCG